MAAFAVLYGKGDREMTNTAEHAFTDKVHAKVFCSFFLNIEDVWVAVGAVKPGRVLQVGEERPSLNPAPLRFKAEDLVKRKGFIFRIEDALLR